MTVTKSMEQEVQRTADATDMSLPLAALEKLSRCSGAQALRLKENFENLYGWQSCQDFRWWAMSKLTKEEASELIDLSGGGYSETGTVDIAGFEARCRELGWHEFTVNL